MVGEVLKVVGGVVGSLSVDGVLKGKHPPNIILPLEGNQFPHNIFCCDAVPDWVKSSAESVFDPPDLADLRKIPCRYPSPEMARTIAQEGASDGNDGVALPLPRVPAVDLSPRTSSGALRTVVCP